MNVTIERQEFEMIGRNLYRADKTYYRLFARDVFCLHWLVSPKMVELADIDVATGKDVYGSRTIEFDYAGTVSKYHEYIPY